MNRSTREGLRELSAGEWDSVVGRLQQIDDNEAVDFILRAHFPVQQILIRGLPPEFAPYSSIVSRALLSNSPACSVVEAREMALGTSVTVTVAAFELDDCAAISHRDAGTSDSWASER